MDALQPQTLPISQPTAQRLDEFCRALQTANGADADPQALSAGLTALDELFARPPETGAQTGWQAVFYPEPGGGGILQARHPASQQEISLSRDAQGAWYSGTWVRLDGERPGFCLFEVEHAAGERLVRLVTPEGEIHLPLGAEMLGPTGLAWAEPAQNNASFPAGRPPDSARGAPRGASPVEPPTPPVNAPPEWGVTQPHETGELLRDDSQPARRGLETTPTPVHQRAAAWEILQEAAGLRVPLLGRLTIGRAAENILCLPEVGVSRQHAVIEPTEDGWLLRDLRSTNGTYLNGLRITTPVVLSHGDVITIRGIELIIVKK